MQKRRVLTKDVNDQEWNLQNVVDTLLNVSSNVRPSVKGLCQHNWFQIVYICKLFQSVSDKLFQDSDLMWKL
jgi:hypothetical protein